MFPGMRDYYAASDEHLVATRGRSIAGAEPPRYLRHQQLRLALPGAARAAPERRVSGSGPWIAIMPAGSGERALYPSAASWCSTVDALRDAMSAARFALLGKLEGSHRSSRSSIGAGEVGQLLAHTVQPLNCFDLDLAEQLAVAEACHVLCRPTRASRSRRWPSARRGSRSPEAAGSSTSSTACRSARSSRTRIAIPAFGQFGPLTVIDDGADGSPGP
jgi:hypothetical protein